MAPTAVLLKLTTTTTAMTTTTNNNLSAYIANNSVVNSAFFFGTFQDTAVWSINLSIRTIVPSTNSAGLFRTVMIAIPFIRHIIFLFSSLSVFLSNLTVPVAAYFPLSTGSTARKTESIVDSIRLVFFFSLIIFKTLSSSTPPINQRWYRI